MRLELSRAERVQRIEDGRIVSTRPRSARKEWLSKAPRKTIISRLLDMMVCGREGTTHMRLDRDRGRLISIFSSEPVWNLKLGIPRI